jgi:phosphoglycerate dehydrogenase-like enzyme
MNMKPAAAFLGREAMLSAVYGPEEREMIERLVRVAPLPEAEILLGTWGMPRLDEAFFGGAPGVRAVFYAAGSVRGFVTDAVWQRGVRIASAWAGNAVPVADYTVAAILFSLKWGWRMAAAMQGDVPMPSREEAPGTYGSTIGLISLGAVGRLVAERLHHFDLRVLAYDPLVSEEESARLGVARAPLKDLFERCDVVSLHAPLLPETRGMVTGAHLAAMKRGATFINTARGAVVREGELIDVLRHRPDLQALLDVTDPEPPAPTSPLRTLPNVVLTPHVAGSIGRERRRLGRMMAEEVERFIRGEALRWEITEDRIATMAMP